MTADNLVSRQYQIAANCQASVAYLGLADRTSNSEQKRSLWAQALQASQQALDLYQYFGFIRVAECVSEEVLFRHSLALEANQRKEEAGEYLKKAHIEMMRKHDLIPEGNPFRKSFLENIRLHRVIRSLYESAVIE